MNYQNLFHPHRMNADHFHDDENVFPILDPVSAPTVPGEVKLLATKMNEGNVLTFTSGGMIDDSLDEVHFLVTEFHAIAWNTEYIAVFPLTDTPGAVYSFLELNETTGQLVFNLIGGGYFKLTNYEYCEIMLERFFIKVFGKTPADMHCPGILSGRVDKMGGLSFVIGERKIPIERAELLCVAGMAGDLTEALAIPTRPDEHLRPGSKNSLSDWVLDNYAAFEEIFDETEKLLKIREKV